METKRNPAKTTPRSIALTLFTVWWWILACSLTGGGTDVAGVHGVQTGTASAQKVHATLNALATQTAQVGPVSTAIPPAPTSSPSPTHTEAAPTSTDTLPPTISSNPVNLVLAHEIHFRPGGTTAFYQKPIKSGETHQYTLRALNGQTLILTAASPDNDVYLDVQGVQDDQHLLSASSQSSHWSITLPKTQTYQVDLTTNNPGTYYFLSVEVPANIYFETGAYSATVDGYVDVDTSFHPGVMTRVRYLVYAAADQTMTVDLSSPHLDDLSLGVYGQEDGQVYLRFEVKNHGYEGVLPSTQGYYLDVVSTTGNPANFSLYVKIK